MSSSTSVLPVCDVANENFECRGVLLGCGRGGGQVPSLFFEK